MLTLKQIREDKAFTLERLAVKGVDATEAVEKIEALDDERKSIQAQLDACLAQQNAIAKEVGMLLSLIHIYPAEQDSRFGKLCGDVIRRFVLFERQLRPGVDRPADGQYLFGNGLRVFFNRFVVHRFSVFRITRGRS